MDARTTWTSGSGFRPESFFVGATTGGGIVRDPFGKIIRRCAIVTSGSRRGAYGAIHFDETFTYDNGEVDVWRWVMTPGRDGHYMAAEAGAGAGIAGRRDSEDYVLTFRPPVGRARGLLSPRYSTRFSLLAPDIALKAVALTLLGAPWER